jgi:hypothetical protein
VWVVRSIVVGLLVASWAFGSAVNQSVRERIADREQRRELDRQIGLLERHVLDLARRLGVPEAQALAWWTAELERVARARSLALVIERTADSGRHLGDFQIVRLSMSVTGTFAAQVSLLAWLEQTTPRARLESIRMERTSVGQISAAWSVVVPVVPGMERS